LDNRIIGMTTVAGLCDAVAEAITGQASHDERTTLLDQVGNGDRATVEGFYDGVRAAFEKCPEIAVSLFFLLSLDDISLLSLGERFQSFDDILSLVEAAHRRGYIKEQDAEAVISRIEKAIDNTRNDGE